VAVNQVSLFLCPPRWRRLTRHPKAFIADAVPDPAANAPPLPPAVVKGWLAEHGFTPVEWGRGHIFERGQLVSIFGPEKEIEVSVGDEAEEVTGLYCRFTLPRRSPPPLTEWAGFGAELCACFRLQLGSEGTASCGEAEFLDALRSDRNYREFAASFGWEVGRAEPSAVADPADE
jgi:hypothetical protein